MISCSVAGTTPVVVRRGADEVLVVEAQNLARDLGAPDATWLACDGDDGKESFEMAPGAQVMTHDGWTALERVTRRPLPPGKPLVRVWTRAGLIDIAGDDDEALRNLHVGKRMLHVPRPAAPTADDDAEEMPLADMRIEGPGASLNTRLVNADAMAHAVGHGATAEEVVRFIASELHTRVVATDPLVVRGVHLNNAMITLMVTTLRRLKQLGAAHGEPAEIYAAYEQGRGQAMMTAASREPQRGVPVTAPREIRAAFWAGMAGGVRDMSFCGVDAAHAWMIAESLGVRVRFSCRFGTEVMLTCEDGEDATEDNVRGVVTLPTAADRPIVYDLSTATRHYAAGVGRLVVKRF